MLNRWPFVVFAMATFAATITVLAPKGTAQVTPSEQGRFTIIINPSARADTFLLDTASGNVWQMVQLTDVAGQPTVWSPMKRY